MKKSKPVITDTTITEAPVGVLQRGYHTLASKLGSDKSGGRLVTADIANRIRKEYDRYIGITGYDYDVESLEAFIQHKGLATDAIGPALAASTTGAAGNYTIGGEPRVEPVVDFDEEDDIQPVTGVNMATMGNNPYVPKSNQTNTSPTPVQTNVTTPVAQVQTPVTQVQTPVTPPKKQATTTTTSKKQQTPVTPAQPKGKQTVTPATQVQTPVTPPKKQATTTSKNIKPTNTATLNTTLQSKVAGDNTTTPPTPAAKQPSAADKAKQAKIDAAKKEVKAANDALEKAKSSNAKYNALYTNKNSYLNNLNTAITNLATLSGEKPELVTAPPKPSVSLSSKSTEVKKNQPAAVDAKARSAEIEDQLVGVETDIEKATNEIDKLKLSATQALAKYKATPTPALKKQLQTIHNNLATAKDKLASSNAKKNELNSDLENLSLDDYGSAPSTFGSELTQMHTRMQAQPDSDKPVDDNEQANIDAAYEAYDNAVAAMNTGKQTAAKEKKLEKAYNALVALGIDPEDDEKEITNSSVFHEYDYILAESSFSPSQVDKILLDVVRDNIRSGNINLSDEAFTGKPKHKSGQYSSSKNKKTHQKVDLRNIDVNDLIKAIGHMMKVPNLKNSDKNQIQKLLNVLKALK